MKILCLAAHVDDVEIGCGGSIIKLIEEGNDVYYIAFSIAEDSLPKDLPKDILLKEAKLSIKIIGINPQNVFIYRYPVRKLPQFRQEILEDMVKLNKRINPDLVFCPSLDDTHQDHRVIAIEGFRAFKYHSMLGYEIPSNNINFKPGAFIILKKEHIDKKIKALKSYKSQNLRQISLGRKPSNPERLRALAQVRGNQIRVDYAEAFDMMRWVIK